MLKRLLPKTPIIVTFLGIILLFTYAVIKAKPSSPTTTEERGLTQITAFKSVAEFREYLTQAPMEYGQSFSNSTGRAEISLEDSAIPAPAASLQKGADRVSETNVQVLGIDEPDIVKTDGREIFFSVAAGYYPYYLESGIRVGTDSVEPLEDIQPTRSNVTLPSEEAPLPIAPDMKLPERVFPIEPQKIEGGVKNIRAFPPEELDVDATIEEKGDILLREGTLLVFGYDGVNDRDKITAYDVTDPQKPTEKWQLSLEDRTHIVDSRLYDGSVYLVSERGVNQENPCPIKPFVDRDLEWQCQDIYHPATPITTNVTYTVTRLDPVTGEVTKGTSFVGAYDSSTIYMSENAIYLTYYYPGDFVKYLAGFVRENSDLFPTSLRTKITNLQEYDLSTEAKMTEISTVLSSYYNSLSQDESLRAENEINNRMEKYQKAHVRDLGKTGIVKISNDKLTIESSGMIPGALLNQFSLDEYERNIRVATTVGQNFWGWGFGGGTSSDSTNDVYILDKNLQVQGSILDLGLEERIYSVRFIEDRGYLVTFRETDPFYVLDLSNPRSPTVEGELKIPGYSSYLHPINQDLILGIGKEDSQIKVSLFDVSNPTKPQEIDKYTLKEYWSDVLDTHHAFLLDTKHQIFFLPGSQGGYVFSYEGNSLKLQKAVSVYAASRALYLDDYLYIISTQAITVLDENTWEEVNEFPL